MSEYRPVWRKAHRWTRFAYWFSGTVFIWHVCHLMWHAYALHYVRAALFVVLAGITLLVHASACKSLEIVRGLPRPEGGD